MRHPSFILAPAAERLAAGILKLHIRDASPYGFRQLGLFGINFMRRSTFIRAAALIPAAGLPAQAHAPFETPIPAAALTCFK